MEIPGNEFFFVLIHLSQLEFQKACNVCLFIFRHNDFAFVPPEHLSNSVVVLSR